MKHSDSGSFWGMFLVCFIGEVLKFILEAVHDGDAKKAD